MMESNLKRSGLILLFSVSIFLPLFAGPAIASPESNSNGTLTPIHEIQGEAEQSAFIGKSLTTSGVITGLTKKGFFIQAPDKDRDANEKTSEGLFVLAAPASFPEVKV